VEEETAHVRGLLEDLMKEEQIIDAYLASVKEELRPCGAEEGKNSSNSKNRMNGGEDLFGAFSPNPNIKSNNNSEKSGEGSKKPSIYQNKYCYLNQSELRGMEAFKDNAVIVVKAPPGTILDVPDPDLGCEEGQKRFQAYVRSPSLSAGRVDVYLVQDGQNNEEPHQLPPSSSSKKSKTEPHLTNYAVPFSPALPKDDLIGAATAAVRDALSSSGNKISLSNPPSTPPHHHSDDDVGATNALINFSNTPPSINKDSAAHGGVKFCSSIPSSPARASPPRRGAPLTPGQARMMGAIEKNATTELMNAPMTSPIGRLQGLASITNTPVTGATLGQGLGLTPMTPIRQSMVMTLSPSKLVKLTPGMKVDENFSLFSIDGDGEGISEFFTSQNSDNLFQ